MIHLLNDRPTHVGRKMPSVSTLHTRVDATSTAREPQVRDLGKIFGGFPNLENLFVSVDRREMDCWKGGLRTTRIVPLVLAEDDAFPRLRSLSISGYYNVSKEASLWRELLPDTITPRTGENLRQFRQYRPDCFEMDYEFAKKIEIHSP